MKRFTKEVLNTWSVPVSRIMELPRDEVRREKVLLEMKEQRKTALSNFEPSELAMKIYDTILDATGMEIVFKFFDYIQNEIEFEPLPVLTGSLTKVYLQTDIEDEIEF